MMTLFLGFFDTNGFKTVDYHGRENRLCQLNAVQNVPNNINYGFPTTYRKRITTKNVSRGGG